MIRLKSYVLGTWHDGEGDGSPLHNPTTGAQMATTSTAGIDFAKVMAFGRDQGGPALRAMTFAARGAALKTLSKSLYEMREELIAVSIENGGTTRSDAKFDIDGATATLAAYAGYGKALGDKTFLVDGDGEQLMRSARFYGYHLKMPRPGVAVHINAFNFPSWGMCEKLACAILAGMPVVTKPATSTALLAYKVMERIVETGALPAGALQFICGSAGDMLDHVTAHDVVAFTGGSSTAKTIRSTPAIIEHNVRTNIEADSINATVLGADVERGSELYAGFVRHVVTEMTQKAGQKCTGTRRIFVPAALADGLQSDLIEQLSDIKVGNPATDGVRVGPLATKRQQEDAFAGIEKLKGGGAQVVFGSPKAEAVVDADADKGFFVGPTLLRADDVSDDSAVHAHEVFGPVSTILPYPDDDVAAHRVALGGGGLVCSLYTNDQDRVGAYVQKVGACHGRVLVVNDKTIDSTISPGMVLPSCIHGGPGRAGGGEELGGLRGLDFYSQRVAVQGDRGQLERAFGLR